ncbi:hypothetical protein Xaut_0239 [Xanthobacter versatilis]|uniref:Uncharacterized protein n=1 Tax=Xanthobacter autotrophicus (strain ATCC BAA-1158 / Py2) TaxID=78245 RepID=A7IBV4_XANP2|nr:hypothetical protein Xaut_0239 [Xanthobacter autotrophicus Py2]
MNDPFDHSAAAPLRLPPGQKRPLDKTIIAAGSVLSGAMLGLAMPSLVGGEGIMPLVKAGLLAAGATIVSYGINRLAVERGAPLAVVGYKSAAVLSVVGILAVGGGLFGATYPGLVYRDVEQLRLEAHGRALATYAATHAEGAAGASRIAPAMAAIRDDLEAKFACEVAASCVSGKAKGGHGSVARALDDKRGRAAALLTQVEQGERGRATALRTINALQGSYDRAAASEDLAGKEKRRVLQGIDLELKQAVAVLDEAVPVALLTAYGEELKAGGEPALAAILRGHGASLDRVIAGLPEKAPAAPAFPRPTGVSDTFFYTGHFLPIAAIAAVTELVFPVSLWLYTYLVLSWVVTRDQPRPHRAPSPEEVALQAVLPTLGSVARKRPVPLIEAPPTTVPGEDDDAPDPEPAPRGYGRRTRTPNGHAGTGKA